MAAAPRSPTIPSRPGMALLLRRLSSLAGAALLASCAAPPDVDYTIDRSITAKSQSSRIQHIVLHYTVSDRDRALTLLSQGEVSSHYLVTDDEPPKVYQLVDENRSAWHAGRSHWRGRTWLNATSIGIEIVNRGHTVEDGRLRWQPYTESQISTVTALVGDIARRHGVPAENIVGHSDIAPQRKQDPGPLFPWAHLAAHGLVQWYDATTVQTKIQHFIQHGVPDVSWFQQELQRMGYEVPLHGQLDEETLNVLKAFQMKYRPSDHTGLPDTETAALLAALNRHVHP